MNTQQIPPQIYAQAWRDFQAGKISEAEWTEIAKARWQQAMEDTEEVFQRLASR